VAGKEHLTSSPSSGIEGHERARTCKQISNTRVVAQVIAPTSRRLQEEERRGEEDPRGLTVADNGAGRGSQDREPDGARVGTMHSVRGREVRMRGIPNHFASSSRS
jgi:hypothetical protein